MVNGAEVASVGPGSYHLDVQAEVSGCFDVCTPEASTPGRLLPYNLNVLASPGLSFLDVEGGFMGNPDGKWDSTADPFYAVHNEGLVNVENAGTMYALSAEGGAGPAENATAISGYSTIVSGMFTYEGDVRGELVLTPTLSATSVALDDGSVVVQPTILRGAGLRLGIPDPASAVLLGLAAVVVGLTGRRR